MEVEQNLRKTMKSLRVAEHKINILEEQMERVFIDIQEMRNTA